MWYELKNDDKPYFFRCKLETNNVNYYLYNLKEVWTESCSLSDVIERAKNLNKRINYDTITITTTLKSTTPTTVLMESTGVSRNLYLKYHIEGHPFHFHWNLKLLDSDEVQKMIMNPLFLSIHFMAEQIQELKKIIKAKDVEIQQYKNEGAVIARKTVVTQHFDEEYFDERYTYMNDMSKSFTEISKCVRDQVVQAGVITVPEKTSPRSSKSPIHEPPRKARRRRRMDHRRQKMLKIAQAKQKAALEFQSSQSQPDDELVEINKSLDDLNAKRLSLFNF